MKTFIGGAICAAVGAMFMLIFLDSFFDVLKGTIPVMLLMGGGLALYLGFDELKDTWEKDASAAVEDKDKQIEELKKEVESLKKG